MAADWPDRVRGLVCLASGVPLGTRHPERLVYSFSERLDTTEEWAKYNRYHWLEGGYRDFVQYFGQRVYTERHSTKQIEDLIGWGLDVEPATLVASVEGLGPCGPDEFQNMGARIRAPVLVIHGDADAIIPHTTGAELAAATGGRFVVIAGGGHFLHAREPVVVNRLIKHFVDRIAR